MEKRKIRLGGPSLFPRPGKASKNPSVDLAQRAFKVLTAAPKPSEGVSEGEDEGEPSALKGYGSLEELIGIEGAPNIEKTSPPEQEKKKG